MCFIPHLNIICCRSKQSEQPWGLPCCTTIIRVFISAVSSGAVCNLNYSVICTETGNVCTDQCCTEHCWLCYLKSGIKYDKAERICSISDPYIINNRSQSVE